MAQDPLVVERLYRQTLNDIRDYVNYCYVTTDALNLPASIVNTLQDFDDLLQENLPFVKDKFRVAVEQGAGLIATHSLALGDDDKERTHILAALADLGFFIEDDIVYADFTV